MPVYGSGLLLIILIPVLSGLVKKYAHLQTHQSHVAIIQGAIWPELRPLITVICLATVYWFGLQLFWPLVIRNQIDDFTFSLGLKLFADTYLNYGLAAPAILAIPLAGIASIVLVIGVAFMLQRLSLSVE